VSVEDGKAERASKRVEAEEEMSEGAEAMSEDEDYQPSSAEESDSGSENSGNESESGASELEEDAKRHADVLKKKRKALKNKMASKKQKLDGKKEKKNSTPKPDKKIEMKTKAIVEKKKPDGAHEKKEEKKKEEKSSNEGEEGQFDPATLEKEEGTKKYTSKKREAPIFNDKNIDYNLFTDAPENVMARKIKISNTVMVTCKMIDAIGGGAGGLSYDYAALTFMRKIQNQKAFEFNLPLALAPNIIEALRYIMKDNPKFFKRHGAE